ncbi:vacuolar import and degradation protein-domain-containing protein [Kalaharituber pfeilii]|nr:vacuolar import and degradation protein-domain-containing protein [Kalaharituber pfeilii]
MPTPDEIRRHEIGRQGLLDPVANTGGRQRPQLACPDEIPLTLSQWRQSVANNHESQEHGPASPVGESIHSPADPKQSENQDGSDCVRAQSIPSPSGSVDQKFQLRSNTGTSLTSSSELSESHSPLSLSHEYSTARLLPSTSCSFLRPGARFVGKQSSGTQQYDVQVDLKHVDMSESFLCGYLRIQGLTDNHPTLTTYFEAEMIGPKYSFQTRHREWGATEKIDFQHWAKFPAYRPISQQAKKPNYIYKNFAEREYIFMRWKEYFLVPDHRVRQIYGASFEGFYYVCFHQLTGSVSGIYFHTKSEKFQKLELSYVSDRCFGSYEFR